MQLAREEIDRLNDLITEFLQFARPAPTKPTQVDLGSVVEDLARMFEVMREPNDPPSSELVTSSAT